MAASIKLHLPRSHLPRRHLPRKDPSANARGAADLEICPDPFTHEGRAGAWAYGDLRRSARRVALVVPPLVVIAAGRGVADVEQSGGGAARVGDLQVDAVEIETGRVAELELAAHRRVADDVQRIEEVSSDVSRGVDHDGPAGAAGASDGVEALLPV